MPTASVPVARERAAGVSVFDRPRIDARSFFAATSHAAVAANIGHVQLAMPASAGVVAIIDRVCVRMSTADVVQLRDVGAELTTLVGRGVDSLLNFESSRLEIREQDDGSGLGTRVLDFAASTEPFRLIDAADGFYIIPGRRLTVAHATVNIGLSIIASWREVPEHEFERLVSRWK